STSTRTRSWRLTARRSSPAAMTGGLGNRGRFCRTVRRFKASDERALLRTRNGTLILVCMNMGQGWKWGWDEKKNAPLPETRLDVWSVRSVDGGKTWIDAQPIMEGYCGAIRDMIETSDGKVVVPVQPMLYDQARHATQSYAS